MNISKLFNSASCFVGAHEWGPRRITVKFESTGVWRPNKPRFINGRMHRGYRFVENVETPRQNDLRPETHFARQTCQRCPKTRDVYAEGTEFQLMMEAYPWRRLTARRRKQYPEPANRPA